MTDILSLPAGRDTDALVAETMGYRVEGNVVWFADGDFSYLTPDMGGYWSPSTDRDAAMEALERFLSWQIEKFGDEYGVTIDYERDTFVLDKSLPLAISRAILLFDFLKKE